MSKGGNGTVSSGTKNKYSTPEPSRTLILKSQYHCSGIQQQLSSFPKTRPVTKLCGDSRTERLNATNYVSNTELHYEVKVAVNMSIINKQI